MKARELREKTVSELKQELVALWRETFNLRMQRGSDQQVRSHFFKQIRRNIARINTVLREKELQGDAA